MKRLHIFFFFCFTVQVNAQTITITRTASNNAGDNFHQVSNVFCDTVGKTLKAHYPAHIEIGSLSVTFEADSNGMTLTYSATIEPCDSAFADYYFDHRGALSANRIKDFAEKDARNRACEQYKVVAEKFKTAYGNCNMQSMNHKGSVRFRGLTWSIHEHFITAKKN